MMWWTARWKSLYGRWAFVVVGEVPLLGAAERCDWWKEKREQRGGSRSEISRGGARRVRTDQLPRPRSVRRKSNDTRGRGIVTLSRIYAR